MNERQKYLDKCLSLKLVAPEGFLERFSRITISTGGLRAASDVVSFNRLCESFSHQATIFILCSAICSETNKHILEEYVDSGTVKHLTLWLNSIIMLEKERDKIRFNELISVILSALIKLPLHRPSIKESKLKKILREILSCRGLLADSELASLRNLSHHIYNDKDSNDFELYKRMSTNEQLKQKYIGYYRRFKQQFGDSWKQNPSPIQGDTDTRQVYDFKLGDNIDWNNDKIYPNLDSESKQAFRDARLELPPIIHSLPSGDYQLEESFCYTLPTQPTNIEVAFYASYKFNQANGHPLPRIQSFIQSIVNIPTEQKNTSKYATIIQDAIRRDSNSIAANCVPIKNCTDLERICPERRARNIPSKTAKYCGLGGEMNILQALKEMERYSPLSHKDYVPTSILKTAPVKSRHSVSFIAGPLLFVSYPSVMEHDIKNQEAFEMSTSLTRPIIAIDGCFDVGSEYDPPTAKIDGIEYPRLPEFTSSQEIPSAVRSLESSIDPSKLCQPIHPTYKTKKLNFKR